MHRAGGDFQISGTHVGLVRRQLAGCPPEFREGTPSMDSAGETDKEG